MPKWLNLGFYFALALLLLDVIAVYAAIHIVHAVRIEWLQEIDILPVVLLIVVNITALYIANLYQFHRRRSATNMAVRTFLTVLMAGLIVSSILYATKSTDVTTVFWRGNLPIAMASFAIWASVIRYIATVIYDRTVWRPNWLVVGSVEESALLKKAYLSGLSPGTMKAVTMQEFNELLASQNDSDLQIETASQGIILATNEGLSDSAIQKLMQVRLSGTSILGLSDFYEQYLLKVPVQQLKDSWFIFSGGFSLIHHDISLKVKRLADVFLAAIGLVLSMPVMIVVACLVAVTSRGPILYVQERQGQKGKVFNLRKFRSMVDDAEAGGAQWSQENDPRVTWFGKFIRTTRLDELPQLWNVLIGDMSFIGPRPERPTFVEQLKTQIPYYDLRHTIKPGITGWAQVMYPYGRSTEDALRKLEYDLYYIKNYSLAFDIYILLRTVKTVFSRSGS